MIDGFLNILKPPGMTSHDVVSFLRGALREKRIGHCGTLDPQAAGALPICLGQATRLASYVSLSGKTYYCEMIFGYETDTQDIWGNTTRLCPGFTGEVDTRALSRSFIGEIDQEVPAFSSVKREGKSLHRHAREGRLIEGVTRKITINSLDFTHFDSESAGFVVDCGSGTYVRALCRDIGRKLDTAAVMAFLVRLRAGSFLLKDSITLEEIMKRRDEGEAGLRSVIIPKEAALRDLPSFTVCEADAAKLRQGQSVSLPYDTAGLTRPDDSSGTNAPADEACESGESRGESHGWVKDADGGLIAIGRARELREKAGFVLFKPDKTFA